MTDLQVSRTWRRRADIPEHVIVKEMDWLVQKAEEAQTRHHALAYEMGYERVRIEQVREGDVIASPKTGFFYEVAKIAQKVYPDAYEVWVVEFTDANGNTEIDSGQLVSRQYTFDASDEPF